MRRGLVLAFLLCILKRGFGNKKVSFSGDRVIRVVAADGVQLQFVKSLVDYDQLNLDFWTHPSDIGKSIDIQVTAAQYPTLAKLLKAHEMTFQILIMDVQSLVNSENSPLPARSGMFEYGRYNQLPEIEEEMKRLVGAYPNLAQLLTEFGQSYEGRTIHAIKEMFFVNCGIHAREWVTQATCMVMINKMLSNYGKDTSVTRTVDRLDWVIMPVFNVDGYVYTHQSNRMWRKTRSPNAGSSCIGTDPNRNWNFAWGGVGSSGNPCSSTYYGSRPFSEVEVRNVASYLYRNRRNLIGYMDIHAYSQLWMTPWGYKRGYPDDYKELKRVSDIAVNALTAEYGTKYLVGPSSIIIYPNSGSTKDWAYGFLGVKYAFALELRDDGRYGFLLPADQIMPTALETFAAIKAMGLALQL